MKLIMKLIGITLLSFVIIYGILIGCAYIICQNAQISDLAFINDSVFCLSLTISLAYSAHSVYSI